MPSASTPLYGLPHLIGSSNGKDIKTVSKALAEKIEATLQNKGAPPLDSDLVSLLTRLAALEDAQDGTAAPTAKANLTAAFTPTSGSMTIVPLGLMPETKGGFQLVNNGLRIPRAGRYRAQASGYTWAMGGSYRRVSIFKGSEHIAHHTQNGPWTIGPALIEFDALEGDLITVRTEGDGSVTFQPVGIGDAPTLAISYVGAS